MAGADITESLLPVRDLLELLQEQQQTGSISTSITFSKRPITGRYIAQIDLEQGRVTSYKIYQQETRTMFLEGQEAYGVIERLKGVTWTILLSNRQEKRSAPYAQPSPPSHSDVFQNGRKDVSLSFLERIPVRLRHSTPEPPTHLSRLHRQALWLVDGRRTALEIANLLHLDPLEMMQILQEWVSHTLITFDE